LAYYSIAPTQVTKADVPRSLAGGYSTIPGYLLARLALDTSLQGEGLGAELLVDALGRIVEAARTGGGRLIVVDSIDEQAHAFYRRHDFIPVEGAMRLYLKVATARRPRWGSKPQTEVIQDQAPPRTGRTVLICRRSCVRVGGQA